MQIYLLTALTIILIPIVVEDFRHREISLLWVLGTAAIAIWQQLQTRLPLLAIGTNTLINLFIIALNYGILTLYFSIKNNGIINIKNEYLGMGDIVFLVAVAFLFSPVNFICFLLLSLLFTLLLTLVIKLVNPNRLTTIPLAGSQAFFLAIVLVISFLKNKNWETNNDELTLSMIINYAGIN